MSYATSASSLNDIPLTSKNLQGKPTGVNNDHYCRLTRYVHGKKNNKNQNYKTFLVNVDSTSLQTLSHSEDMQEGVFLRVHIPIRHKLLFHRYNLTLEDLRNRLSRMDVRYPLCVVGTYNSPGSRLNYLQALEDKIDGVDYIMIIFVPAGMVNLYKGLWPNQILVEVPFDRNAENIRDIVRQSILEFGRTAELSHVFIVEDDIYAAYDSEGNPISLLRVVNELQQADSEEFPLVGVRSVGLSDPITSGSGWKNNAVSGLFLLRTSVQANFSVVDQDSSIDAGLTQFERDANNEGIIQENQSFVLRRGYTIYDPVPEDADETLRRLPKNRTIESLQPEQNNLDLRVTVISNQIVVDQTLPDGTRYVRSLAIVGDETASAILIGAGEEQVELLQKDAILDLRGAKVQMFNGFMRLIVNRGVIIPSVDQTPQNVNHSNVSVIEYELVD